MNHKSVFVQSFTRSSDVESNIREACDGLRLADDIGPASRVVIKPNFTYPWHKPGVTTTPGVLEAMIRVLRDYTSHIRIVESDGGSNAWTAEQSFAGHGVPEICRKYGVTATGLTQERRKIATAVVAGEEVTMELPAVLLEHTDFLITMPVPKVHVMTGVSLGFKNQWGCIPDVKRLRHHPQFPRKILAVNKLLRTRMAVFDGTWFLNRTGPMNGDAVRRDTLVIGDVGTATRVCCELMRIPPSTIPHLSLAVQEGLMPETLTDIRCNVELDPLCSQFRLERRLQDWLALLVFHSDVATHLCYDSRLAAPLHTLAYLVKGKPRDFTPDWKTTYT